MSHPICHFKDIAFKNVFDPAWLAKFDAQFVDQLAQQNPLLAQNLGDYRYSRRVFTPLEVSALLLACAPFVENRLAQFFEIEKELALSAQKILSQQPIFAFKQWYVQREARRLLLKKETLPAFGDLNAWLDAQVLGAEDKELAVALLGQGWLQEPEKYAQEIEKLVSWCAWVVADETAKKTVQGWVSFHLPQRIDYYHLVPLVPVEQDEVGRLQGACDHWRIRDGFALTDLRMSSRQVLSEIDYCVYCHTKEGDFCSKGFPVKKGDPSQGLKKIRWEKY